MPGLIAIAQSSDGSVANVEAIQSGAAESGLVQADVAYWGSTGTGLFEGRDRFDKLRFLASLYPEHVHVVLPKDSRVRRLEELEGKTIGVGLPGSGAQVGALLILNAVGLEKNRNFQAEELNIFHSAQALRDGRLDAFLTITGAPSTGIAQLASEVGLRLLAIPVSVQEAVTRQSPVYFASPIPAYSYDDQYEAIDTLAVRAQWLVSSDQSEDLVYGITRALWSDVTRKLMRHHAKGAEVKLESALDGRGIPLHDGARRFYREKGMLE